jgi:adenine deaminase
VRESVRVRPVGAEDFEVRATGGDIRAIGLVADQVVTESLVRQPTVEEGLAVADPVRDLAKIAVIERHHATGRTGLGFVVGSGLRRGALASTVAHDAHNLVVMGMTDRDMAYAVERVVELGGGIVVVGDERVLAECPLPIAGLLSDAPLQEVIDASRACNDAAKELGWSGTTPFLTMSFLALSVIPHLKITDRGLVDVDRFELVSIEA